MRRSPSARSARHGWPIARWSRALWRRWRGHGEPAEPVACVPPPCARDGPPLPLVLYVEGQSVSALLMQALFRCRPDLELEVVARGADALARARLRPPALLLLDVRLPDGDGCDWLDRVRELPGLQDVRAVAVTAECLSGLDLRSFDELWPKPLHLPQVLEQIDIWFPPCAVAERAQAEGAQQGMDDGTIDSIADWAEDDAAMIVTAQGVTTDGVLAADEPAGVSPPTTPTARAHG